ncbi:MULTISPECIES: hypothetical protein [Sorangium]|uniref:Secreted protein n=1 Tax=Sorangium cellulosum TaxID=56 RepID=A0A4P2QKC8_SORCE|nr:MULTISPECIES: hypothetical protein [Sorangium]AUX30444.1 hypothetical protein SOCE836_025480 [Sorangium cellulosum]WCQ89839.1 hypothetical protein NQZ70_02532 [Sorangium sp. Soce836]
MRLRPPPGALPAATLAASALLSLTAPAAPPEGKAEGDLPSAAPDAPVGARTGEAAGDGVDGAQASDAAAARPPPPPVKPRVELAARPPPLHVEYAQYGVALVAEISLDPGAVCPRSGPLYSCILGSGGGLAIRGGYRSPGPWYFGGAYQFTKMDSSNLYRLGIFQQLRAEMRYMPDIGYRAAPYFSAGVGGVVYGNEWGVETGGALIFGGVGVELEVSRRAVLGVSCVYRPVLIAGWKDTANYERGTGIAQFVGFELLLEVRTELGRR